MGYKRNEQRQIRCGQCGVIIVTGRTKGQTAKKFCSERCKWKAWDLLRKVQVEGMGSEASEIKTVAHREGECSLPDCFCHVAQRLERERSESAVVTPPTFTEEWESAPRAMTNYVESNIAEYWFLRGVRAGEAGAMVTMNEDLREIRRVTGERLQR